VHDCNASPQEQDSPDSTVVFFSHSGIRALVSLLHRASYDTANVSWWHANLCALIKAGLDPSWALRFVRANDLRTLDLLLAHGADIGVFLLPLPDDFREWRPSRAGPWVEEWLRALHERGLDIGGIDLGALCNDQLALWASLRPLAWSQVVASKLEPVSTGPEQ
jgi:hypothetical protein